ncbi:MAG: hypothetical protein P8K77_09990 [Polaribacter sp.]|nr:hypothetical protein [Polaribacter sp.]
MKKTTLILVALIAFSFVQCDTLKMENNPPFKITGATFNNWVGGRPGVSGIKVHLAYQSEDKIAFEQLYFSHRSTKIEMKTVKGKTYIIAHFNTSTREEELFLKGDASPKTVVKLPKSPFKLKNNEAVISYKEGTTTRYYQIKNIKKTKTIVYP